MPGRYLIPDWKPVDMIPVLIPAAASITFAIYTLAFPPSTTFGRKLSTFFLGILVFFSFRHSEHISPSFDTCDTFARASLIWFAHMSYELCILEFTPDVQPGPGGTKERIRQAYKVFYDRSHTQVVEEERKRAMKAAARETNPLLQQHNDDDTMTITDKKTDEAIMVPNNKRNRSVVAHYEHGCTRWQLVRYHVIKAALLWVAFTSWDIYLTHYSPISTNYWSFVTSEKIPLLNHIPQSFDWKELFWRLEETLNWSIFGAWFYESSHSICAVIHVGLGIDGPNEWSLGLFGSLKDAWTVRRYWSKYWHNFIYTSFSAHVKGMTRGWFGMKRGRMATRLVENTLVFFFSGLMHSVVRWQEEPDADFWSVTVLYTVQMIPIIVEAVFIHYWRRLRQALGYGPEVKWLGRVEYAVGYLWVFSWMFYCVPTYWILREWFTEKKMAKRYMVKVEPRNETALEE